MLYAGLHVSTAYNASIFVSSHSLYMQPKLHVDAVSGIVKLVNMDTVRGSDCGLGSA